MTGRRWWHDERLPGSKVGGAVRVVGRRVQQRLPVHGTVVILVDEHPDLVVWISRILPEERTRAGVVVNLRMRLLVIQNPREKRDRLVVVILADREVLRVDLTLFRRCGSDGLDVHARR